VRRERRVEVIAHRGASEQAPENTLAAFRRAAELGADWFELDCTLARDGALVVIHDDSLERTTDGAGPVAARTLAELQALDAGAWKHERYRGERIPTLSEALDLARELGIGVYVEVKPCAHDVELRRALLERAGAQRVRDEALSAALLDGIERSGSPHVPLTRAALAALRGRTAQRLVLQSFSPIVCALAACAAPELRVELLAEGQDPAAWAEALRWVELLDLSGLNPGQRALSPARVAALTAAGRSIAVWTVNEPEAMAHFARLGVDRLITDRPDVCLEVLESAGLRGPARDP